MSIHTNFPHAAFNRAIPPRFGNKAPDAREMAAAFNTYAQACVDAAYLKSSTGQVSVMSFMVGFPLSQKDLGLEDLRSKGLSCIVLLNQSLPESEKDRLKTYIAGKLGASFVHDGVSYPIVFDELPLPTY